MCREEEIPALQPAQPQQPAQPAQPAQPQQPQQPQQDQQDQDNHTEVEEEVKSHFNGVGRSLGSTAPSAKRPMTDRERRLAFFQRKQ